MDYKISTSTGIKPPVLTLNGKIAITHFESDNRQLFETEEGSFVYKKDKEELVNVNTDTYTKLLLKLNTFMDTIEYKTLHKARL